MMPKSSLLADVDRTRLAEAYPDVFRPSLVKRVQTVAKVACARRIVPVRHGVAGLFL